MLTSIKQKFDGMQRFREASLETHFTKEELEFIKANYEGSSFKEQLLRSVGLGVCKHCGKNTQYKEKLNFYAYCSDECSLAENRKSRQETRADKLEAFTQELSNAGLEVLTPEKYVNVGSVLKYKCVSCTKLFSSDVNRALKHECKIKVEKPKIEKEKKDRIKKEGKKNLCVTCGCERNPKALVGQCMTCRTVSNRAITGEQYFKQVKQLGYTVLQEDIPHLWDKSKNFTFTNLSCGHTSSIKLGNLLSGASKCPVCGPKIRAEKMLNGFMKKYSVQYNVKEFSDYSSLVRQLSDKNWNSFGTDDRVRGMDLHLDHKVPIMFGFKNNIAPEVIADIDNLQLLEARLNIAKGDKFPCYETLELLKEKYGNIQYEGPEIIGEQGSSSYALTLQAIKVQPTKIINGDPVFGDTTLKILRNNKSYSMGLLKFETPKYLIVFEDEIYSSSIRRVIESRLLHSQGKSRKIFARKCEIKDITPVEMSRFLNGNHLLGSVSASYKFGLFYENELVSVMTFSKSRFLKEFQFEMIRFANKLETTVIGGASKLLSHFKKIVGTESICTYSDNRFGSGNNSVYASIGMKFIRNNPPSTWWVKGSTRLNNQDLRSGKIRDILGTEYNEFLSNDKNMEINGWVKIEDLGSSLFCC